MKTLFLLMSFVIVMSGCEKPSDRMQSGVRSGRVIARINKEPVYEGDVLRRIRAKHGVVEKSKVEPNLWQRMFEAATEDELLDKLLLNTAVDQGIQVSKDEVEEALKRSKQMLGEDRFRELLKQREASEQDYRKFLRERRLIGKYKERLFQTVRIDDETLETYYEGHKDVFSISEGVRLEIMVFASRDEAQTVYQRLKAGGDFDEVFREYSAVDKKHGRRTRWMPYEGLPLSIQQMVRLADVGEVLEPVQDRGEFQIIKIKDKRSARVLSYDEARGSIRKMFLQRKQQKILDDWFETAKQENEIEYVND